MNSLQSSAAGFTLVELIVTLAIAIILLALGIPAFQDMTLNNQRSGRLHELVTALQLARSESVKRGIPVSISRAASWDQGWTIYVDDNGSGNLDAGEEVLRLTRHRNPEYRITSTNYPQFLTYNASGAINTAGNFKYCDNRSAADPTTARAVIINNTGRPRMSGDGSGNKVHEDENGVDLICP